VAKDFSSPKALGSCIERQCSKQAWKKEMVGIYQSRFTPFYIISTTDLSIFPQALFLSLPLEACFQYKDWRWRKKVLTSNTLKSKHLE
jgi:hypothetical protein